MAYEKITIDVTVKFLSNGGIKPLYIEWKDGQRYKIDRIIIRETAPCRSGVILVERFRVMISGKERYLYYDKEKEFWFVEKEV